MPLKSSGLMSSNKAVIRAVPKTQADRRQLQGLLARPRRRRPLREGHLELQDQRVASGCATGGAMGRPGRRHRGLRARAERGRLSFADAVRGAARRARVRARPPAGRSAPPSWSFLAAQAVVGVTLGAYMQSEALTAAAHDWLPVTLVSAATLGISMGAGRVLARSHGARRADRDARDDRRRRVRDRHDGRRPRRRRPPRRLHAVPARARRGAAHADPDRAVRRRLRRVERAGRARVRRCLATGC